VGNRSPFPIRLSEGERRELETRLKRYTLPHYRILRARMILLAAEDLTNEEIARQLGIRRESVSLWRKRFFRERLDGLEGRPRPGRPKLPGSSAESR
jgi:CRP-like cAMP-binding protein